ncbi:hypothetical protein RKE29_26600, partial [Streptomyces sp. B1866]|nr:hypothetical protein [Streptomyces sp. B1866]
PVPPFLQEVAPQERDNLGPKLQRWNDTAESFTEEQITGQVSPGLRLISQKGWGSARLTDTYEQFQTIIEAVGHTPGYQW